MLWLYQDSNGTARFVLLCLVQLTPFFFCLIRRKFDYIALVGFLHFVYYSIPKYSTVFFVENQSSFDPISLQAIHEVTLCFALQIASYYFFKTLFFHPKIQTNGTSPLVTVTPRILIGLTGSILVFHVFTRWIPSAVLALAGPASNGTLLLLLACQCPGRERLVFYCKAVVVAMALYSFVLSSSMLFLVEFGQAVLVISFLRENYRNIIFLMIFGVIGAMVQSVKGDYRTVVQAENTLDMTDRWELLVSLVQKQYFSDEARMTPPPQDDDDNEAKKLDESTNALLTGFGRLGDDSLEKVLEKTPSEVPFWNGESYLSILYLFVPRAIWPGKPSRTLWHDFGMRYGYLNDDDYATSISVGYLAEGYMNYGYLGLYGVAILMSLLIALAEWGGMRLVGGYYYFIYAALMFPLSYYSGDLSSAVMNVVMLFSMLLLLRRKILRLVANDAVFSGTLATDQV